MAGRVKTVMLFANGNIAAFDENNHQIAEIQCKTAIELWAEFATRLGYDVEGCECRTQLPGGIGPQVILSLDAEGLEHPGCCNMPCHRCIIEFDLRHPAIHRLHLDSARMILCDNCGNKRCPHASDHRLACTNSNEPQQPGSVYSLSRPDSDD